MDAIVVAHVAQAHHGITQHLPLHQHFGGPDVDYVAVALAAAVSWIGVPGAGEAALIAAGIAAAHHRIDIVGVLVMAWAGATAGGSAGWLAGRIAGRPLVVGPGPLRKSRQRLVRSGDRFYDRFGVLAVYFAPSWMAGINRMRARRFLLANTLSAVIWALLLGLGSFYAGPSIAEVVGDLGIAGLSALAVVALVVAVQSWRRRRQRSAGEDGE